MPHVENFKDDFNPDGCRNLFWGIVIVVLIIVAVIIFKFIL